VQELERRPARRYGSVEEVAERMRRANPRLTAQQALERARTGTVIGADGGVLVKVDRYVYTTQPDYRLFQFTRAEQEALWRNLACPVLYVTGTESQWRNVEHEARAAALVPDYRMCAIAGAGHHVHHERPEEFLAVLLPFLGVAPAGRPPGPDRA
jgi:pimeloyl-ACP methyl ester carboxylesterase